MNATAAIVDVGHGNSVFVQGEGSHIVVDCGLHSSLLEFLLQRGIESLDVVLLSHADSDHIGGLIGLIAAGIKVHTIRANSDAAQESKIWRDLLLAVRESGVQQFSPELTTNDRFDGDGFTIEVVAPEPTLAARGAGSTDFKDRPLTSNSMSAVFRIWFGEVPVALLGGDLDDVGLLNLEESLQRTGGDARANSLVFPHHGGLPGRGDPDAFARRVIRLVSPDDVFFSSGRGRHGTPRPEVVDAILDELPGVRIACTQLSERCAAAVPSEPAVHLTADFAAGKDKAYCCAGTITIAAQNPSNAIVPTRESHNAFIRNHVTSPLCKKPS